MFIQTKQLKVRTVSIDENSMGVIDLVESKEETVRGASGFGSTGQK